MSGYKNIQAYKNAFGNVDKVNQVIMLYDTAIASIYQARQAIEDKNIQERYNKISHAFKIITGLRDSLDHANGGEVAAALTEWYSGTALRILSINRSENLEMCDLCITHIKQMREAWIDVEKNVKAEQTQPQAPIQNITSEKPADETPIEAVNKNDYFEAASKVAIGAGAMNISV